VSYVDVLQRVQLLEAQVAPAPPPAAPRATAPSPTTTQPASAPATGSFAAEVQNASAKYGVDTSLIDAVMQQESGGDPNATSGAGAEGLMQLMPDTAAGLGVTDPYDPTQSIDGGTQLLGQLLARYNGKTSLALAAYNAGPGAVDKFGGVPPYEETQNYVADVSARYDALKGVS
jgi:soluble lytic murein transglycosylase-like protein